MGHGDKRKVLRWVYIFRMPFKNLKFLNNDK